jgi:hypothetical protein
MAAKKKAAPKKKAEGKRRPSKFQIPPKGKRCARIERPKEAFHKDSFRWVRTPDKGKGAAFVLVACPKMTRTKNMPRKSKAATTWNPTRPLGKQCVFKKDGTKAGLVAHMVVQAAKRGACRTGYSKK